MMGVSDDGNTPVCRQKKNVLQLNTSNVQLL